MISLERIVGMSDENINKRIEFIIEQQAQFSVDINSLTSRLDKLSSNVDRLSNKVETLAEIQSHAETRLSRVEESFVLLVQWAKITDERLDVVSERSDNLSEGFDRLSKGFERLSEGFE